MTSEQVRATGEVLIRCIMFRAEIIAIRSMLNVYYTLGQAVPANWEKDLAAMKELPDYRQFLESFEPEMSQVSQDASETHLIALLQKIEGSSLQP